MSRPAGTPPHLDPFDGTPLTRPPPIGFAPVAVVMAATVLLCLGLAGRLVGWAIGSSAVTLTPDAPFVGPLNTSLPVNCVHVVVGIAGLLAGRSATTAQVYLGVVGLVYMIVAFVDLLAMAGAPGATLLIHDRVAARGVVLPDVAPLAHCGLGAGMIVLRAVAMTFPTVGRRRREAGCGAPRRRSERA